MIDDESLVISQKEVLYKIRDLVMQTNVDLKVILGCIDYNDTEKLPSGEMKKYNAAAVIGKDIQMYHKRLLPNYDVFFEQRYFEAGKEGLTFKIGKNLVGALTICEDIRDENYDVKPIQAYKDKGVDVVFNISSSPFTKGKLSKRMKLLEKHARDIDAHLVYVNQAGGQDELVFDGASMVMTPDGNLRHLGKRFQEDVTIVDTEKQFNREYTYDVHFENEHPQASMIEAMKLGMKEYLAKTGIQDVVIGIS